LAKRGHLCAEPTEKTEEVGEEQIIDGGGPLLTRAGEGEKKRLVAIRLSKTIRGKTSVSGREGSDSIYDCATRESAAE